MRRLRLVTFIVGVLGVVPALAGQAGQAGQGDRVRAQPIFTDDPVRESTVPVGSKVDIRLRNALDSGAARIDQRFEAATTLDVAKDGRVLIPAVTPVRGFVSSVRASSSTNRTGSLTLSFDAMKIGDQTPRLRASVEQVFNGQASEASTRLGADASVAAALGRLPGGGQALLVGVRVAAGGSIESTEAADVRLPVGTVLRIRIDQAVQINNVRQ